MSLYLSQFFKINPICLRSIGAILFTFDLSSVNSYKPVVTTSSVLRVSFLANIASHVANLFSYQAVNIDCNRLNFLSKINWNRQMPLLARKKYFTFSLGSFFFSFFFLLFLLLLFFFVSFLLK